MTNSKKGFGSLEPEQLRELSSKGGKAPRKTPTGFAILTVEQRKKISRLGGLKSKRRKKV